jgi:hypothetical protein
MKIIRTSLMPENTGFAFFPGIILIGQNVRDPLIKHELRHKEQQARDGWLLWTLRYVFSIGRRLEYEAEAYAVSAISKCIERQFADDNQLMIENELSNLMYYNAWLFWKPHPEVARARIAYYFEIELKKIEGKTDA